MKRSDPSINPYLQLRQSAARAALAGRRLDGLLITHPADLAYLTNFTGDDSIGLLTADHFYLITDFRYTEQAAIEAPWLKIIVRDGKMSDALAKTVAAAKAPHVGFETNFTTFGQIESLKKALRELAKKRPAAAKIRLTGVDDLLVNIRKVKDPHEIAIIREAVTVAQDAFLALRQHIRVGQTENDLAGRLIYEMRLRGASDGSFPAIIAAGPTSSLPHYRPAEKLVTQNQPLLIDWGARFKGYCSDLTRTLLIGKVSPRMKQIYNVTLEAQLAAIDAIRPGVTNRAVDKIARDIIAKAGFAKEFGHGLGHGIGRDIHELPVLRKSGAEEELQPGMIVTVEPGIYLPGHGGVRIEDDVLITHDGHQVLSNLDKTFEGCHLE